MQISISSIRERRGAAFPFEFSIPSAEVNDLPGDVCALTDLRVRGNVTNTGESMLVNADVHGEFEMACSRCLQPADATVAFSIRERFRREGSDEAGDDGTVDEDEDDISYFQGDRIDLGQVVREHVALHLPMKPICRDDCRGLCSTCGTNLNVSTSDCRHDDVDPRLAVLRAWQEDRSSTE